MTRFPVVSSLLALLFSSLCSFAADAVEGVWEKSDGQAQIRFKIEKGKLNGYLTKIADKKRVKDTNNPAPARRSRKLLGLKIASGFWKQGNAWVGGSLYDSSKGKTYKGKIWLDGKDKLKMRGYVGVSLIGRTAEWKRVK